MRELFHFFFRFFPGTHPRVPESSGILIKVSSDIKESGVLSTMLLVVNSRVSPGVVGFHFQFSPGIPSDMHQGISSVIFSRDYFRSSS